MTTPQSALFGVSSKHYVVTSIPGGGLVLPNYARMIQVLSNGNIELCAVDNDPSTESIVFTVSAGAVFRDVLWKFIGPSTTISPVTNIICYY